MPQPYVVHETQCQVEGWSEPGRADVTWRTLFSGDRTPTDSLTLGVAEVREASEPLGLHRHAHAETYYILSGHGRLRIGEQEHVLSPGVAAFIPGGALHGARAIGPEPLRILYAFAADAFSDVVYEFPDAG